MSDFNNLYSNLKLSDKLIKDCDLRYMSYSQLFIVRRLCCQMLKLLNKNLLTQHQFMVILQEMYDTALQASLVR